MCTLSQANSKTQLMATDPFLRRKSFGEDPSVLYSLNYLTDSTMASLTSAKHSTSQASGVGYRKANSFSEISTPQLDRSFWSGNLHSLSFDSYQRRRDSVALLPLMSATEGKISPFGCENCQQGTDMKGILLQTVKCCLDKLLPAVDSSATTSDKASCPQASLLNTTSTTAVSQPVTCAALGNICSMTNNKNSVGHCALFKKAMQVKNNMETPEKREETNLTSCSDSDVTEDPKEMLSHCQSSMDLSSDKSCTNENAWDSSDMLSRQGIKKSKPEVSDSTSKCAVKSIVNLTSVLSAPRKTVKKGRPSSKKQKKRQREKRKHRLLSGQTQEVHNDGNFCVSEQRFPSQSKKLTCNQNDKFAVSSLPAKHPQFKIIDKTKVFSTSPVSHYFASLTSCSDDDDDNADDIDYNRNRCSVKKPKEMVPINGFGFTCALDLDTIFKKTIPDPLLHVNTGGKTQCTPSSVSGHNFQSNLCQSSSEEDDLNDSIDYPTSGDVDPCVIFTPSLSLDTLFCKKPTSSSQTTVPSKQAEIDILENVPSIDSINHPYGDDEIDSEALKRVNALWNENYPTAGFRSCSSVSADQIIDPAIKVHFAAEPDLLTIHIVGTEERGGNWHHFVLDRERFERRILELDRIISPVLEASHRARVMEKRNQDQEQNIHK